MNSSLPTILVSCKCDNPENTRQLDVESMEEACISCVEAVKTAANVPESARLCLSSMLRAVMSNRNGQSLQNPAIYRSLYSYRNFLSAYGNILCVLIMFYEMRQD